MTETHKDNKVAANKLRIYAAVCTPQLTKPTLFALHKRVQSSAAPLHTSKQTPNTFPDVERKRREDERER